MQSRAVLSFAGRDSILAKSCYTAPLMWPSLRPYASRWWENRQPWPRSGWLQNRWRCVPSLPPSGRTAISGLPMRSWPGAICTFCPGRSACTTHAPSGARGQARGHFQLYSLGEVFEVLLCCSFLMPDGMISNADCKYFLQPCAERNGQLSCLCKGASHSGNGGVASVHRHRCTSV